MGAVESGAAEVVAVLLRKRVDLDARDAARNETVLHMAVRHGDRAVVEMLLEGGVDRNARNVDEETALHVAVGAGEWALVPLLLGAGIDANARNREGETALHVLVGAGAEGEAEAAAADLLLEGGVDIDAKDCRGENVLTIAEREGLKVLLALFFDFCRG
ncbi:ankyrin repeat-containing domain protein [Morchella snyderi]|nr:ankyrin repeat-containing domain protein [Morchella snyderi]